MTVGTANSAGHAGNHRAACQRSSDFDHRDRDCHLDDDVLVYQTSGIGCGMSDESDLIQLVSESDQGR